MAALLAVVAAVMSTLPLRAQTGPREQAVPRAECGPGSRPEPGMQGVPTSLDGHTCNTEVVGHYGSTGGLRTHRYVDKAGRECAYFDSNYVFPIGLANQGADLLGVYVLDMSDPAHPVKTANLVTPAMLSPHESLSINAERGLLAAVLGNALHAPGILDVYDVSQDCRYPVLKSSTPFGILGHEGEFSPDGKTYWTSSSASGGTLVAVDISDPVLPKPLWLGFHRGHGLNVSDDGNRVYLATLGTGAPPDGVIVLDASQVQQRLPNPQVPQLGAVTWEDVSIPQTAIPVTIKGHPYLVEVDEFATLDGAYPTADPDADVGAARIIDIADETKPRVVSTMKLEANVDPGEAASQGLPNGNPVIRYSAHYCAVPQREDPGIVACSFIVSGLRVFDIRDPLHPKELAYFVAPAKIGPSGFNPGNFAMSSPTFSPERGEVWYTDVNSGFWAVRITHGAWSFPAVPATAAAAAPEVLGQQAARPAPAPSADGARLPSTGLATSGPAAGVAVLVLAAASAMLRRRARGEANFILARPAKGADAPKNERPC